jgi:RNA polymerase sigma-32 factor
VNRFPLLTPEQEIELGRRLVRTTTSMRAQHSCCRICAGRRGQPQVLGYGLPQADLIQEGNIG